jgi:phage shock protein A
MARALYGHTGSTDEHLVLEVARLRRRITELETEVDQLRAALSDDELSRELRELAASSAALA